MRRFFLILAVLAAASALLRCVSKTVTDVRFTDSAALPPITASVTPADPENFTFAIVGDLHIAGQNTSRFQTILNAAEAESDSFIILLGDIVDKGLRADVVAYQSALSSLGWTSKAFSVIGNHDIFGDGWDAYKELNGPSHYSFTVGNSKFIALDTADGTVGPTQEQWLEGELAAQPRSRHVFLLSHYLPVVPGIRTYLKLADERESIHLMKLTVSNQVTAWLGAHYHSFATGNIDGVDYVDAGGGGGVRMDPVKGFFFVQVVVAGDKVTYQLHPVP